MITMDSEIQNQNEEAALTANMRIVRIMRCSECRYCRQKASSLLSKPDSLGKLVFTLKQFCLNCKMQNLCSHYWQSIVRFTSKLLKVTDNYLSG